MRGKHLIVPEDNHLFTLIYQETAAQMVPSRLRLWWYFCAKALLLSGMLGWSYCTLLFTQSIPVLFASYILFGLSSVLLAFNFGHELAHQTVLNHNLFKNGCFLGIFALLGVDGIAWRDRHVREHHFAPNVPGFDPDLKLSSLIRILPDSQHYWFHRYQHWYAPFAYAIYSLFWIFVKDVRVFYSAENRYARKKGAYCLFFWGQKAFYLIYLLVVPLHFSPLSWILIIAAFLGMHLFQSIFILFTFLITHHVQGICYPKVGPDGQIQQSWLMNQIESSNDIHPFSTVANFILGGFNNHVAHHLFPQVNHIVYPEINKIMYSILEKRNIYPHHTSYFGGIWAHLKLLKTMGRAPARPT
jgi:linoleoyl-CoA desaturase